MTTKTNSKRTLWLGIALAAVAALVGTDIWMRSRPQVAPVANKTREKAAREDPSDKPLSLEPEAQKNIGLQRQTAETRNVVETLDLEVA